MTVGVKLLFTLMSAVMFALGAAAILTESHTGSTVRSGVVSFEGAGAIMMGQCAVGQYLTGSEAEDGANLGCLVA